MTTLRSCSPYRPVNVRVMRRVKGKATTAEPRGEKVLTMVVGG